MPAAATDEENLRHGPSFRGLSFRGVAQPQAWNPYSRGRCSWIPGCLALLGPRNDDFEEASSTAGCGWPALYYRCSVHKPEAARSIPAPRDPQAAFSTVQNRPMVGIGDSVKSRPPPCCPGFIRCLGSTMRLVFCGDSSLMHTVRKRRSENFNRGAIPGKGFDPQFSQQPTSNNILKILDK